MKQSHKTILLWGVLLLLVLSVYSFLNPHQNAYTSLKYYEFHEYVIKGDVSDVAVQGKKLRGTLQDGTKFETFGIEPDSEFKQFLIDNKVQITFEEDEQTPFWKQMVLSWLPMFFLIFIFFLFMRQLQSGSGKPMSFGKSRARLLNENTKKITFADVAGVDEAKEELSEIVEFLKNPKKFTKLGGRIPKGVLLMGSPGTGKTLLARAVSGEAGVPFFTISGSDFVEMFVGVGASRVRDLFEQGRKNSPCIIFIDEIDAVGRHRGAGLGGGHDEREQTLNQLLVEMDGFESKEGIILVAATNRPDVLDPALLRPGRFDRRVMVAPPDAKGRDLILKVHSNKSPLAEDVDLAVIARGTPGFTGADLENLVNEAALMAARKNKSKIQMSDFDDAKDKVIMGAERRSMILTDEQKRLTAVHEAGHALVAELIEGTDPIHKVTIIPRGMALGLVQQLPTEEKYTQSQSATEKQLKILMGGRAAEDIIFNERTTGAGNDIERATDIAKKMVCEWGMSEKLGPMKYGKHEEMVFLGRDMNKVRDFSEQTANEIDNEVRNIISISYNSSRKLLEDNIHLLNRLSEALIEHESLDGSEVKKIVAGEVLPPKVSTPTLNIQKETEHTVSEKIKGKEVDVEQPV